VRAELSEWRLEYAGKRSTGGENLSRTYIIERADITASTEGLLTVTTQQNRVDVLIIFVFLYTSHADSETEQTLSGAHTHTHTHTQYTQTNHLPSSLLAVYVVAHTFTYTHGQMPTERHAYRQVDTREHTSTRVTQKTNPVARIHAPDHVEVKSVEGFRAMQHNIHNVATFLKQHTAVCGIRRIFPRSGVLLPSTRTQSVAVEQEHQQTTVESRERCTKSQVPSTERESPREKGRE
jgi:hypothetical protein